MSTPQFKATFKGVRGSIPTPLLGREVEEKIVRVLEMVTPEDLKDIASRKAFLRNLPVHLKSCYGGNSSCVYVEIDEEHLIFDGGSGLRVLGQELMEREFGEGRGEAHLFLTHTHWDHIMGIPFFIPMHVKGNRFTVYGVHKGLGDRLVRQQDYDFFPVSFQSLDADIRVLDLSERKDLQIGKARLTWIENQHPGRSFSFRVDAHGKSLVYATDAEYKKLSPEDLQPAVEFFKGADLLIFDSQYTFIEGIEKEDWGHSSTFIGVDLALAAGVKHIAFYHHEPTYSDFKLVSILNQTRKYLKAIDPESDLNMSISQEGRTLDLMTL